MSTSFKDYVKNIGSALKTDNTPGDESRQANTAKPTPKTQKAQKTQFKLVNSADNNVFSNIFIINANREEVVIKFGIHHNWERADEQPDIELTTRVILNPYVAKRLSVVLNRLIKEYEKRYVDVNIEPIEQVRIQAASATKH